MCLQKKHRQTIHVEFLLPLFQRSSKTCQKHNLEIKKQKLKITEKHLRERKDLLEENQFCLLDNYRYVATERKEWAKNLTYSSICLEPLENNLRVYRDTFRSQINVQVISSNTTNLNKLL